MENNDIDIISNESKTNKVESIKDDGDEFVAILDEYIKEDNTPQKISKKDVKNESEENDDYKLYMNICKTLFDSVIKNKQQKDKKIKKKEMLKNDDISTETDLESAPEYIKSYDIMKKEIGENTERNRINQQNDIDFNNMMKSMEDVTKSFYPSKAPITHFSPYKKNITYNSYPNFQEKQKSSQIPEINFCLDGRDTRHQQSSQFDNYGKFTPLNNNQFSQAPNYNQYSSANYDQFENFQTLPTEIIRPYIDEETESTISFKAQQPKKINEYSKIAPQIHYDRESINDIDTAIDEQKIHMAQMLKHLGGLMTSMSHLMVK
jgi:hypothetical protein